MLQGADLLENKYCEVTLLDGCANIKYAPLLLYALTMASHTPASPFRYPSTVLPASTASAFLTWPPAEALGWNSLPADA